MSRTHSIDMRSFHREHPHSLAILINNHEHRLFIDRLETTDRKLLALIVYSGIESLLILNTQEVFARASLGWATVRSDRDDQRDHKESGAQLPIHRGCFEDGHTRSDRGLVVSLIC